MRYKVGGIRASLVYITVKRFSWAYMLLALYKNTHTNTTLPKCHRKVMRVKASAPIGRDKVSGATSKRAHPRFDSFFKIQKSKNVGF